AGDRVLVQVAARLRSCLRDGDTVARLGGDEFAVVVEDDHAGEAAEVAARRIAAALAGAACPDQPRGECAAASIGIAVAGPDDGVEDLLRNADLAMYKAKGAGGARYAVYDPAMHTELLERVRLEDHLRGALDGGELLLHYQPVVRLSTGRVTGVEALIRWQHPERGLVPPSRFVPVAEEMGLIADIGAWALREACRDLSGWRATLPQAAELRVAVNLSAAQLRSPRILSEVVGALERHGLPPSALMLEMTESMLIDRSDGNLALLRGLRRLGVHLAIDDFGTGYSSLSYLRRFPVNVMKIDRSFVEGLAGRPSDAEFVRGIVQLGRSLGLTTVAEGIECDAQLTALRRAGCDLGQGFLFSPPVPADAVPALLGARRRAPRPVAARPHL
ncbi:MAG: bifunctional diguanylate cyclase/phosphodiesterase, partial [Actinomycetota bacterium]